MILFEGNREVIIEILSIPSLFSFDIFSPSPKSIELKINNDDDDVMIPCLGKGTRYQMICNEVRDKGS